MYPKTTQRTQSRKRKVFTARKGFMVGTSHFD